MSIVSRLSYNLARKGQLNLPGITSTSKKAVEDLLLSDAEKHHCYFRSAGLHNHLSHHLLAAYDLGATASHLKKIFDAEAKIQRPIILEEVDSKITVNDKNWVQYLGNQHAYRAFLDFFSEKIKDYGATKVLEKYVFDPEVNKDGKDMLVRLMNGALHPLIQVGYGAEFGNDTLIATGLAQTAIHTPIESAIYGLYDGAAEVTSNKTTVLEILRKVYDSDILHPVMPYDPDALFYARLQSILGVPAKVEEIRKLCGEFHVDAGAGDAEIDSKVEELIWTATLLMAATGKKGRKPRLDFFLMHLVTSSLFLRPITRILEKPESKANLLKAYLPCAILLTLSRGRPRIDPELLMSYTAVPRPPGATLNPSKTALGAATEDADYNPWPAMLEDVVYHPDSHVLKTMRTLVFAAREYGATPAGGAIGAFSSTGAETHRGTSSMDGTIFVRAAGLLMDYMGWVANGQEARPDWDRSALGWEAAWDHDDLPHADI